MNDRETQRRLNIFSDISAERRFQDAKFGPGRDLDPFTWAAILGEEYGEFCQAALEARFGNGDTGAMQAELIQVAAVAVAALECLARGRWNWPTPLIARKPGRPAVAHVPPEKRQ